MFCRYAEMRAAGEWQVLGRVPDRCGRLRPAGSASARVGQAVSVPRPAPAEVVLARVHGLEPTLGERVRTLLYRGVERRLEFDTGEAKIAPSVAAHLVPVRVGHAADYSTSFELDQSTRTLTARIGGVDRSSRRRVRVDFFRLPVSRLG